MISVNCHTDMPPKESGHFGEFELAEKLNSIGDRNFHIWYGIDFIPGVTDIDILIWHEKIGFFAIEVKAIPKDAILSIQSEKFIISGRKPCRAPHLQALAGAKHLSNFLNGAANGIKLPFIVATAWFPLISRTEWLNGWSNTKVCDLGHSLLFKEDLKYGIDALLDRLIKIKQNPPAGLPDLVPFLNNQNALKYIISRLDYSAKPIPTKSELTRLAEIEKQHEDRIIKEFNLNSINKIIFSGKAGTGKTFYLLKLLVQNLMAGKSCLFLCYNKVLASDLRRLMQFSTIFSYFPQAKSNYQILDVYNMLSDLSSGLGISADDLTHDDWAKMVIEELSSTHPEGLESYDVVLIDEAQDLPLWMESLLNLILNSNGSVYIADGPGQELYNRTSDWMAQFRSGYKTRRLNRNFRNSKPNYIASQIVLETFPNINKIEATLDKMWKTKDSDIVPFFEREEGSPPSMEIFDDSMLWRNPYDPVPDIEEQTEIIVKNTMKILTEVMQELEDENSPMDLLILVPDDGDPKSQNTTMWKNWVADAMQRLQINFIDYTLDKNRRNFPNRDQVRLCTYHSSRGIEALKVLIFGFEALGNNNILKTVGNNLAYIAFSRAVISTRFVRLKSMKSLALEYGDSLIGKVALRAAGSV